MAGRPMTRAAIQKLDAVGGEEYVLDRISEGWGIRRICADLNVPVIAYSKWVDADPQRAGRLARAREVAADVMVGEILEIADGSGDARLQVDSRKWLGAAWNRKVYGDNKVPQVQITITAQHLKAARFGDVIDIEPDSAPELT